MLGTSHLAESKTTAIMAIAFPKVNIKSDAPPPPDIIGIKSIKGTTQRS
jgi:hypothetical protein